MRKIHHVLAFCLSFILPLYGFAEAPVVDESENFMLLDETSQALNDPPVMDRPGKSYSRNQKYSDNDEEMALAQDNSNSQPQGSVELLGQLKGMQQEIQELRGQLEVQAHELKLLQQQQLSFYKDLDARLQNPAQARSKQSMSMNQLETINNPKSTDLQPETLTKSVPKVYHKSEASQKRTQPLSVTAAPPPPVRNTNPADEQISYLAAYDLVKNKRYEEALNSMQEFVARYPNGGYTANAQYWLGELYMLQKDYPQAIEHFEIVLKNFSTSSKAAASSLKIGYALAASGKKEEAKMRLQQVVRNYPDTPTAQLAVTKLMTINAT